MKKENFDVLILLARPAAGKSEVIRYLKNTHPAERLARFHVGQIDEIDDFPMLWTWFEEDTLLAEMGFPHLHTDAAGYFLGNHLWDLLVRRICLEYHKQQRPQAGQPAPATTILEFSRGTEHGGYASAFASLTPTASSNTAWRTISWKGYIKMTTGARSVRLTRASLPSRGAACPTWFSRTKMTSPPAAATRWAPG
jgi:hypothetical protein